ncbi:hypothetical protein KUTeg_008420 [Tegillarca granosa]|uniref:Dynein heavy chain hydrolytic ATP-binding dynein motor region domain-containing protein n=1 Tax=Tegillarca granosa TaxID=220873 RepID=A0ABQ9F949_TEGGR|nr:hypothetical protein KUTeg_008420 [Tegillarca granosa]
MLIKSILLSSIEDENDRSIFFTHLRDTFPLCSSSRTHNNYGYDKELVKTIKDQLKEDNLKETEELLTKILQLNAAIEMKRGVIMCGQSGSGKTTCCQTLARALNRLNYLLFAPDHSKDELTTDKDVFYHSKKKVFKYLAESKFYFRKKPSKNYFYVLETDPEMEDDVVT